MKIVCVIGHFGFGREMLDGQTVKTKAVTAELEKRLGAEQVVKIDTHGGLRALPGVLRQMLNGFRHCENIIILPAHNGVRVFSPLCTAINRIFHRKLHYVVIGGWLPEMTAKQKWLAFFLKRMDGIYVETSKMSCALASQGFQNVMILPNFKDIPILTEDELVYSHQEPYKLCTFSRVMKEKGIGEAVEAVRFVNEKYGRSVYTLDIYGQIDSGQTEWFNNLQSSFPEEIQYKGTVPFEKSVDVLKDYHALLFPTYYDGEGFAGTLLDSMAAGVPSIVSDWKYNSEIVIPGRTGILIRAHDQDTLNRAIEKCMDETWNEMKKECLKEASKYTPSKTICALIQNLQ